ncbi:MAG: hypothetical protein LQ343_003950 [Gyalolechia ehrenbergii]|nr:MAG: hypothetical protein LQ343_003950 [Gyalolechia ehrenbergii]
MPVKSRGKAASTTKKQDASTPPKWPPLKPLVPSSSLRLETLLEDQIIVIRNFFTSSLCKNYVSFLSSLPLVTTPGQPKKDDAVRVNDRFQVDDAAFADQLWKTAGLHDLLTRVDAEDHGYQQDPAKLWGGQISAQLKDPGDNDDESNILSLPTSPPTPARTTWTLLIYLTGLSTGCVGGETVFYPELGSAKTFSGKENDGRNPVVVDLEVGMALLHKHGQDCLLHEGREVTQGEKWVIRSDLCVKR